MFSSLLGGFDTLTDALFSSSAVEPAVAGASPWGGVTGTGAQPASSAGPAIDVSTGFGMGDASGFGPGCQLPSTGPFIHEEGRLRTAGEQYEDYLELQNRLAEYGLPTTPEADPRSDLGMQTLIAEGDGPWRDPTEMDEHERLHYLADNDMAPNLIPERHRELMETEIPDEAKASLMALDQDVHNPFELGRGKYNIDEYSVILDELPDGMSPQDFLNAFLAQPNATTDNEDFDSYNEFHAKRKGSNEDLPVGEGEDNGTPGVGNWYNIDIPGNDGDVMIVDKDTDLDDGRISATVQTMTDDQLSFAENHPVSGRRQFGLEKLPDGGYRFYTRGFDRAEGLAEDLGPTVSSQHGDWSSLMQGVSDKYGGRAEHVDADGNPIWGWHEHYTANELLASGVERPQQECPPIMPFP